MIAAINLLIVAIFTTALLIPSAITPIGLAKAQSSPTPPTGITPPIAGQFALGPLTNQYWSWLYGLNVQTIGSELGINCNIPQPGNVHPCNPFTDTTGQVACNVGLQPNGMFFLGGTIGLPNAANPELKIYDRNCNIFQTSQGAHLRPGTIILVPLINFVCTPVESGASGEPNSCGTTPAQLRASSNEVIQLVDLNSLNVAVDGQKIPFQRVQSPGNGFQLTYAPNNPFCDAFGSSLCNPPVTTPQLAVGDGYYALITNLGSGPHTIQFGGILGTPANPAFATEAIYHITID